MVNQERVKAGLSPLILNEELSNAARLKCCDMRDFNYCGHQSPTYGSPFDMLEKFGISYYYAGENVAMGQQTPHKVMKDWMDSQGHRNNILNSNYKEIGVGWIRNSLGYNYWAQLFILR